MSAAIERVFLDYSSKKLTQLAGRVEDCLGRLGDERIWARGGQNENAAGNLVLHLCGNLRQWIISGAGGAPDIRDRDAEFAARAGQSASELAARLRGTVEKAVAVLEQLPPARLAGRVGIQGYEVTVLEAIYSSVEHFGQHTGQIILLTKALSGEDLGYYAHLSRRAHGQPTP